MNLERVQFLVPALGADAGDPTAGGGQVPGDQPQQLERGVVVGEVPAVLDTFRSW